MSCAQVTQKRMEVHGQDLETLKKKQQRWQRQILIRNQHTEKGNRLRWCGVDAQADGHINKIKHMMSKIHQLHGS